jgi:1-acyl-sn-glycerol-3-phosphate acyltransferase
MTHASPTETFMMRQESAERRRRWLHPLLRLLARVFFNIEIRGLENIPKDRPTVLMMNHMTLIDPVVATISVKERHVVAMAKAETMDNWFFRRIVYLWGNFTIRRGEIDRQAIQNAIALLKHNHLLLIAPEGTRNPDTGLQAPKDGLAYIIHKADAIIVPTAIVGAHDWAKRLKRFRRAKAIITFGEPFRFVIPEGKRLNRDVRHAMMQEAMYQLARAIPESHQDKRGIYQDIENATEHYLEFLSAYVQPMPKTYA